MNYEVVSKVRLFTRNVVYNFLLSNYTNGVQFSIDTLRYFAYTIWFSIYVICRYGGQVFGLESIIFVLFVDYDYKDVTLRKTRTYLHIDDVMIWERFPHYWGKSVMRKFNVSLLFASAWYWTNRSVSCDLRGYSAHMTSLYWLQLTYYSISCLFIVL